MLDSTACREPLLSQPQISAHQVVGVTLQITILISLSLSTCALLNIDLASFLLPTEGYLAEEGEELDLRSMGILTSTWYL